MVRLDLAIDDRHAPIPEDLTMCDFKPPAALELAPVRRFDLVWSDRGSGANKDGSFYRPVPPRYVTRLVTIGACCAPSMPPSTRLSSARAARLGHRHGGLARVAAVTRFPREFPAFDRTARRQDHETLEERGASG